MRQVAFTLQIIKISVEKRVIYIILVIWDWLYMEEEICNKKLYEIINDFAIAAENLKIDKIFQRRVCEFDKYNYDCYLEYKPHKEDGKKIIAFNLEMSMELYNYNPKKLKLYEQKVNSVSLPYFLSNGLPDNYGIRLERRWPLFTELFEEVL